MKRLYYSFAACLLIAGGVAIVSSCNQEDDYDDFECNLDVAHHTSLRRSSMLDHWETGSGQSIGGNAYGIDTAKVVPTYKDECVLWAIVTIIVKNEKMIKSYDANGNVTYHKVGEKNYSGYQAYQDMKALAKGQKWQEDGKTHTYTNGAMPSCIATNIVRKSGVMEGKSKEFSTYRELYKFISDPSWLAEHKEGSFMITNKKLKHTSVCSRVKSKKIKLMVNHSSSAPQPDCFTEDDNFDDGFVLIY